MTTSSGKYGVLIKLEYELRLALRASGVAAPPLPSVANVADLHDRHANHALFRPLPNRDGTEIVDRSILGMCVVMASSDKGYLNSAEIVQLLGRRVRRVFM